MKELMKKDWLVRACKTFVQAFGGILIPELIAELNGQIQIETLKALLAAAVCAGSAAFISAVWNKVLEWSNSK